MKRFVIISLALALLMPLAGCDTLDDDRVVGTCRIDLSMMGTWSIYGVNAVGEYKYFVKEKRIPSNFAYTATTYTGNGGVLLIGTTGTGTGGIVPAAYEMACPYCRKHSTMPIDSQEYFMQHSPHEPAQPVREAPRFLQRLKELMKGVSHA